MGADQSGANKQRSDTREQQHVPAKAREAARTRHRRKTSASGYGKGIIINKRMKIGRNVPCPCGSGIKFKRCCGA